MQSVIKGYARAVDTARVNPQLSIQIRASDRNHNRLATLLHYRFNNLQRISTMNQVTHKTLTGPRGELGEVFENDTSFGFYHSPTQTEHVGFADFDSALNAWHCFHDDYFENLPR